jgi:Domain of Unknown Function (DUF1080)
MPKITPRPALVLLTAASLLGWFAAPAQAQSLSDEEARAGFVSLFNGKDLTGWRFGETVPTAATLPPNWKVEDGVIKLSGGNSPHLASQGEFGDFDVRIQWRALREKYNSGFFIRSGRDVKANQINLSQSAVGKLMSGAQGGDAVPALQKPVGEWNDWRVLAVGDHVTFWCNGKQAWEVTGFKDRRGYLGLQAEGAPMEFRNIRIKEITTAGSPEKE